ncbi:MAG: hypothetical protein CR986_04555 [Ignavibacteriae bacterium]|nr:MAG: hypothetical protein CR986_04555 [Ignavibacteriota bacterium]
MLKKIILIAVIGLSFIKAQSYNEIITNYANKSQIKIQDINILAVMVEFQPDKFDLTYGDGTFGSIYSKDYGNDILDPLPHDLDYFADHLKFAKNYYDEVSDENVSITYDVLPDIITVSKTMRDYSPVDNESFKSLGDFSKEVWELVKNKYTQQDFSKYNLFIIFHAGVGKDISTNQFFGEARDLPSVYLSEKKLKSFYGETFKGFPLNNGAFVTNTIILPETESREDKTVNGTTLLELSINGLIVSNIASYLGLPDLYDSETGKSAIGRFGLMDGQSLFAYRGLFPPEPSAWEKIFLGWKKPVVIDKATENISVTVNEVAQENDNVIIKIPISSSEYFLIENRNRDADKNGAKLTYKVGGQVRVITFDKDLDNFNNSIVDTLKGVLLNVDEFDWALPGSGILIWHIDEKIINDNLAENKVNVGDNRGINLVEADGIQDIGEEFKTIFGDMIIAEGEKNDFWFSANSAEYYSNVFGPNTKPNTRTNSGANSLITISNFSDIANTMTFNLDFGNTNFSLTNTYKVKNIKNFKTSNLNNIYVLKDDGKLVDVKHSNEYVDFSDVEIAVTSYNNIDFIFGAKGETLNAAFYNDNTNSLKINTDTEITSPVVLKKINDSQVEIFIGLKNGNLNKYLFDMKSRELPKLISSENIFNERINQIGYLNDNIFVVGEKKFKFIGSPEHSLSANIKKAVLTTDMQNQNILILVNNNNEIYSLVNEKNELKMIYQSDININGIALADLKQDGNNSLVFNSDQKIKAINLEGFVVDNFPFTTNTDETFTGAPISADLNNDGFGDILSTKDNGDIYAISGKDGKLIVGFPISTGGTFYGEQNIFSRNNKLILNSVSNNEQIFEWNIATEGKVFWGNKYGDNFNSTSLAKAGDSQQVSEFFPENRTYNWPNPVYGNETFLRTYVSEDSEVRIKIFDLAGALVDELSFFAKGGIDSEKVWNVKNVESGAYIAHVEVKSTTGKIKSKIVKIAIIK